MADILNAIFGGKDLSNAQSLTLNNKSVSELILDNQIIWRLTNAEPEDTYSDYQLVINDGDTLYGNDEVTASFAWQASSLNEGTVILDSPLPIIFDVRCEPIDDDTGNRVSVDYNGCSVTLKRDARGEIWDDNANGYREDGNPFYTTVTVSAYDPYGNLSTISIDGAV